MMHCVIQTWCGSSWEEHHGAGCPIFGIPKSAVVPNWVASRVADSDTPWRIRSWLASRLQIPMTGDAWGVIKPAGCEDQVLLTSLAPVPKVMVASFPVVVQSGHWSVADSGDTSTVLSHGRVDWSAVHLQLDTTGHCDGTVNNR